MAGGSVVARQCTVLPGLENYRARELTKCSSVAAAADLLASAFSTSLAALSIVLGFGEGETAAMRSVSMERVVPDVQKEEIPGDWRRCPTDDGSFPVMTALTP